MRVRTDIVRMYKEVHGWVGIIAGLALFIAFYAGAITMFEEPLQRWASPPARIAPPPSLEKTPALIAAVVAAHPEASKGYDVNLAIDSAHPARISWTTGGRGGDHGPRTTSYAALDADGRLQVVRSGPSPVAGFVNVLHQQVGLPFGHAVAMPIMGAIALLYVVAIVSGIIVLLPTLVRDLFALRVGENAKRMWLDVHNLLGMLSLPFHLVMALTAVVFAFHDGFYAAQGATFAARGRPPVERSVATAPPLAPAEIVHRLAAAAPGFTIRQLSYRRAPDGTLTLRVAGSDPRYGLRAATYGIAEVDPYSGAIVDTDYMPGHQDGWSATVTSFFALHYGNFGGTFVRWSYFLLGIAGAFLFYTGNLLWVESRRRRERKAGVVEQTQATRILAALTVGVPLGSIAGIAVTVAVAKPLEFGATPAIHAALYWLVFLAVTGWALRRGAPRAAIEMIPVAAAAMLLLPLATILSLGERAPVEPMVDVVAIFIAAGLLIGWQAARRRARYGSSDSVWAA